MKNLIIPVIAFLSLVACEEKPIDIPDLSVGRQRVLVEEVTGVRCPQCPEGGRKLIALQKQFGKENVILVAIHAAQSFSVPFPQNKYDFRSTEIQDLTSYVGDPFAFPTAAVNRKYDSDNDTYFLGTNAWGGTIGKELSKDYGIGLYVNNTFDAVSRTLDIKINVTPEQNIDGDNRLTVLITQDSIVDMQDDGGTKNPNFVHRHVLRDVVSQPTGETVGPLTAGVVIQKSFSVTLPADFDPKHCDVVAVIHRPGPVDKEVLQAAEGHVQN